MTSDLIRSALTQTDPGNWHRLESTEISSAFASGGLTWVHLDGMAGGVREWLETCMPDLDETVAAALVQAQSRPWAGADRRGLLVVFRAVNPSPDQDREDMLGIRIWVEAGRIITITRKKIPAVEGIADSMIRGDGPTTVGEFLALLAERVTDEMEPFLLDLDEAVDELEGEVIDAPKREQRRQIVALRLTLVELRRHMPPQRDALKVLQTSNSSLLEDRDRREIMRSHDRMVRLNEHAEELRDNLVVLRDELAGHLSDRINEHMYLLSIVSLMFLPLTFLTGLFGINLGGIPGAGSPLAFGIFSAIMVVLVGVQLLILRRMRWI